MDHERALTTKHALTRPSSLTYLQVQQDGHEFMKLFLTLLEQVPELSAHSLFRGRSGYQTMCMSCNKLSQSSQRFDDFLELDIPIKGFKGLQESLGSLLCPEILDGDNQYFCGHCDGKRDATRQLTVKDLPQVLCLSLQRFVFDLKKMDRVKANDKFSFPLELPASMITHEGSDVYDLEGILLHKGSSARQGHYVAHVNSDGVWYRFDDGDVSVLDKGPQGHPDHGGRASSGGAGASNKGRGKVSRKKRGRPKKNKDEKDGKGEIPDEDEGEEKWAQCENASCSKWRVLPTGTVVNPEEPWYCSMNPDPKHNSCDAPEADWDRDEYEEQLRMAGLVMSQNAYLLVYKLRGESRAKDETKPGKSRTASTSIMPPSVVAWLTRQKTSLDADFQKKVEMHKQLVDERCREVDRRRELVRGILDASRNDWNEGAAAVAAADGVTSSTTAIATANCDGYFVMSSWLEMWVNAEPKDAVPAVNNQALLCPHNALDPSKVQAAKRLSTSAWEQIVDLYGGAPALGLKDVCKECLLEQLDAILLQEDVEVNRDLYLAMCDELDLDGGNRGRGGKNKEGNEEGAAPATTKIPPFIPSTTGYYFVGRQWLKNWRSRNGTSMGSSSPTSSLVCKHGMLIPAHPERGSNRVLIPADFWAYLKRSWSAKIAAEDRKDRFKQAEKTKKKNQQASLTASKKGNVADEVEIIEDTTAEVGAGNTIPNNHNNGSNNNTRVSRTTEIWEFMQDAQECPECREELYSHLETQPLKEEEKLALRHLVSASQNLNMEPNVSYKMVPVEFLNAWRAYMGPSKATNDPPELTPCMQAVACSSHGPLKIAFPAPPLVNRRGRWMYANGSDETFEIIAEADWEKIWAAYGTDETPFGAEGITVVLTIDDDNDDIASPAVGSEGGNAGEVAEVALGERLDSAPAKADATENENPTDKKAATNYNIGSRSKNHRSITVPGICHECVMDREQAIRASLLNFESAEVMVEIFADESAAAGLKVADVNQRQSKRARKNRAPIRVDSTTTLENAKLRMFEALGVHPKNIRAFLRGTELLDDSKPLLHYEVMPMDEIRIVDTGVYDVNDLASIFPEVVLQDRDDNGREGFTGTALHGM